MHELDEGRTAWLSGRNFRRGGSFFHVEHCLDAFNGPSPIRTLNSCFNRTPAHPKARRFGSIAANHYVFHLVFFQPARRVGYIAVDLFFILAGFSMLTSCEAIKTLGTAFATFSVK
jgi:hypothetical protein